MLSKEARKALKGWESDGSGIIKASFKIKKKGITLNTIQCYPPTNDNNEDDQSYERLQSIIAKCSIKDLTILMGDLNAKVGMDNTGYEDIMGRHGLRERNENGDRFANLCASNKEVIGGTTFPHKRKATWLSPDHTTENQVDHLCINKNFRRSMGNVRTRRGADITLDHHLIVATTIKLKLKKQWTAGETALQGFDTAFLRNPDKINDVKIALSNSYQALQDLPKEKEATRGKSCKRRKYETTISYNEETGREIW
ncbi:unnamed protein product [Schistosoma margrebowiei]|uniref:Uncharacterized protein n=1 Tax=Schistosoma margrebowiei TaxID=48269 RepID=A0A183N196_9TREM|nr:unnamed protein product [Schistosoma margrebowiei]